MGKPIVDPPVPYVGTIPDGLEKGKLVRIQGVVSESADRFNINLQSGPESKPRDNTALHLSVRLNQGYIARNTYLDGNWGDEQGSGTLPIGHAQHFEILILCEENHFKIAINGQHFCEFPLKLPIDSISHLLIDGDVFITLISWEPSAPSASAPAADNVSFASTLQSTGPSSGGYGQPPQQQQGYGPTQAYGSPAPGYGPPPGGYAQPPPGGYGQPPPYYGPPPAPGAQPESGLDNFMETAQSVLAGAIASGAAQRLIGNILNSGPNQTGYSPQNAQYGQYPHPPPQQHYQDQSSMRVPQFGGEGSVGGLGSVGSILSSLAGQVFNTSRDTGRQQYH